MAALLVVLALTLLVGILALNFATGEKRIEQRVERLYATADPAFVRAMGVLFSPAILPGKRFEALLNGDRIFSRHALGHSQREEENSIGELHLLIHLAT